MFNKLTIVVSDKRLGVIGWIVTFLLISILGAKPAGSRTVHAEGGSGDMPAVDVSGYLRTLFEYEEDEIAGEDFDAAAYLFLNVRPKKFDRISFHFYGRARSDLDGESVTDDALDRADSRVFQAYLDVNAVSEIMELRLGRQWLHEIEGVYIDGLKVSLKINKAFDFDIFGGRPASVYSSADGQAIFGALLRFKPFRGTHIRLDAVRSDEQNPIVNDHVGLHLSQKIGNIARISYDQKFLNKRGKDLRVGGTLFIPEIEMEISGHYFERTSSSPKPSRDDVFARYFSDFYLLLEEIQELKRYSFNVLKYFGNHFIATAGASFTDVREKENPFNRDTERYFVSFHFLDILVDNLNLSVDANIVNSSFSNETTTTFTDVDGSSDVIFSEISQDDESFFITGEIEYELKKGLCVSLGSAYGDYDFERARQTTQPVSDLVPGSLLLTNGSERFVTRTYFAEVDWKYSQSWRTKILVEYDRSKINSNIDSGDYLRAGVSLTYKF